jgi:hypothetical protein
MVLQTPESISSFCCEHHKTLCVLFQIVNASSLRATEIILTRQYNLREICCIPHALQRQWKDKFTFTYSSNSFLYASNIARSSLLYILLVRILTSNLHWEIALKKYISLILNHLFWKWRKSNFEKIKWVCVIYEYRILRRIFCST